MHAPYILYIAISSNDITASGRHRRKNQINPTAMVASKNKIENVNPDPGLRYPIKQSSLEFDNPVAC